MASNGISTLATKEQRQKAKLELAASKLQQNFDIYTLPTQYQNNDIIDNDLPLLTGRPWIDRMASGGAEILSYDNYANGERPSNTFDLSQDKYYSGSLATPFEDVLTHVATTNGTMIDSDGTLKWRPHNLSLYSEQLDNAAWGKVFQGAALAPVVTADNAAAPDGTMTADIVVFDCNGASSGDRSRLNAPGFNSTPGAEYKFKVWVRSSQIAQFQLRGDTGATGAGNSNGIDTVTTSPTWTLRSVSGVSGANAGTVRLEIRFLGSLTPEPVTIEVWRPHVYRSDLGGMANNPDTGDSYVPTASTAVYLPRRNHHNYNGSAWTNEGVLHESETRTNLVTYSNDFSQWVGSTYVTANATTSPDGTTTGNLLTFTGADQLVRYITDEVPTVGLSYTNSIWLKAGSSTSCKFSILFSGSGLGHRGETVTLTSEWQRFSISNLVPSGTSDFVRIRIQSLEAGTIEAWGAQVEVGSTPSSYIPTNGSQVARAGDQLVLPHENISWPEPKVIGAETWNTPTITDPSVWQWDGTTLTATGDGTSDTARGDAVTAGGVYLIAYNATHTSGLCQLRIGNTFVETVGSSGLQEKIVVAGDTTGLTFTESGSFVGSIDNISVKEIEPLALSIHMQGLMTYADGGNFREVSFYKWTQTSTNEIETRLNTAGGFEGLVQFVQDAGSEIALSSGSDTYSPDINIPFNIASRHGSTFVNGAADGTALTENTAALPDLENTDLTIGYTFMGTIKHFSIWNTDITDAGLEEATTPSIEPSLSLAFDGSLESFTIFDWSN